MGVREYKVLEIGGSFVVVAYDERGRPQMGAPLGSMLFVTRAAAETALASYLARPSRPSSGDDQ